MPAQAKNSVPSRRTDPFDRMVVYHGIKIAPMSGKLSPTAKAIREALRSQAETASKSKRARGKPARG